MRESIKKSGWDVYDLTYREYSQKYPRAPEYVRTTAWGLKKVGGKLTKFRMYWSSSSGGYWFIEGGE